jgi:hypothetical protein
MEKQCAKLAMKNAGVSNYISFLLINYISPQSTFYMCHPCSLSLISRTSQEMLQASSQKQWDICGTKLLSLLMILGFGFLDVFKENLQLDKESGQVVCNSIDYERFSQCCIKKK